MCAISVVMDSYYDRWSKLLEDRIKYYDPCMTPFTVRPAEIVEFKEQVDQAHEYDKLNNQPDCGTEAKKAKLLALAKELNIDISFIDQDSYGSDK